MSERRSRRPGRRISFFHLFYRVFSLLFSLSTLTKLTHFRSLTITERSLCEDLLL